MHLQIKLKKPQVFFIWLILKYCHAFGIAKDVQPYYVNSDWSALLKRNSYD